VVLLTKNALKYNETRAPAGVVSGRRTWHDTFGQITNETNPAVDHLFGYTGRETDEESDLYYYRARYYDPATGQFISEDPIGFEAGDANTRRYVGNSPTNATDPSGLQPPDSVRDRQHGAIMDGYRKSRGGPTVMERFRGWLEEREREQERLKREKEERLFQAGSSIEFKPSQLPHWADIRPWRSFPGAEEDWSVDPRSGGNITSAKWQDAWTPQRLEVFIRPFLLAWGDAVSQSAKRNCIPEGLLWNVILAEFLSFGYVDYLDLGHSIGPAQLSPAMLEHYNLKGYRRNTSINIELAAQKIDKQLVELHLASVVRSAPAYVESLPIPDSYDSPAFDDISPVHSRFFGPYTRISAKQADSLGIPSDREYRLSALSGCDLTKDLRYTRTARRANPMVAFELIQVNPRNPLAEQAILTAVLAAMNDALPNETEPALYARHPRQWPDTNQMPTHAWAMRDAIMEGRLGYSKDGRLTVNGKIIK